MYKRAPQGWMKHLDFIILDLICLELSYLAAYVLRNGWMNPYQQPVYREVAAVLVFIDIFVILFCNSVKNVLKRGRYAEFTATVKHVAVVILLTAFYLFSVKNADVFSRGVLYYLVFFYCLLGYVVRQLWKRHLRKRMKREGSRSLLIVTTDSMVGEVVRNIQNNNYEMFRVSGISIINRDMKGASFDGIPVVADRSGLLDYACREWIDEVFFNLPADEPCPQDLADRFIEMGVVVHVRLNVLPEMNGKKQFIEPLGSYKVLTATLNYATPLQSFLKRSMDIAGGLVGSLAALILMLFIGPAIYLQSPGPILFKQVRVGKNGRKFKMYKFRSMYLDAEERKQELMAQNRVKDGMMFKLDWDPRIIGSKQLPDGTVKKGIGNFIRDWSLDEFPQFFNVLKGDMSLIGTRPPTVDEWEKYELHHRVRLAIRPGITGMWQVSGRSNITDFEEVVKMDTEYICNWSMGLDIKILLKTVGAVFRKDGAM